MTLRTLLLASSTFFCVCHGQPPIGLQYITNISMGQEGSPTQSGVLWALNDWTLFAQDKPATRFPNQLNLGDQGAGETYVAYNPATSECNGRDPLYCRDGQSCQGKPCIALFDNPFEGLPDSSLAGKCFSGANKWVVSNGGYTLTYCITSSNDPLSLVITGAGGTLVYNFSNFREESVPKSTFSVPSYCACGK